uniref:immunoglobulin mu heavy chain-like n=1 Tax=Euleptes europaea TaxID=460621 RepID=UPI0025409F66|nr:immunoglobulin mu heavy chain-like [Euleptes europaea]
MLWTLLVVLVGTCCMGSGSQSIVSQPQATSVSPGKTVKLSCVMASGNSISGYSVYWYQQKPGNPPKFLLRYYSDSSKDHGSEVPTRFSGSKDTSSNICYLNIAAALAEDEADYYCAVWHSSVCHSDTVLWGSTTRIGALHLFTMFWAAIVTPLVIWCTGSDSRPVLTQPPSASVSPGDTVKLSCLTGTGFSFSSHDLYWFQQKPGNPPRFLVYYYSDSSRSRGSGVPLRFSASKDVSGSAGYLTIVGALAEDEADYYCASWSNAVSHCVYIFGGGTHLTVLGQPESPPKVHLFPPSTEEKESKNKATLVCLMDGFYPPDITVAWEADGAAISSGVETTRPTKQNDKYVASSYLTMDVSEWERRDSYTCKVTYKGIVYPKTHLAFRGQPESPPAVHLFPPSAEEKESKNKATLVCLMDGFNPPDITVAWEADGATISSGVETTRPTKQNDKYVASSYLTLDVSDWERHERYTCKVMHKGNDYPKEQAGQPSVAPTVLLFPPSREEISTSSKATLVCLMSGFHPAAVQVAWMADGNEITEGVETSRPTKQNDKYVASSYLTVREAVWKSHESYTCKVTHQGQVIEKTVNSSECQPSVAPTVLLFPPSREEISTSSKATLVCLMSGFHPAAVQVAWMADGNEITEGVETSRPTKQNDKYVASSYLTVREAVWKSHESYTCKVTHQGQVIEKTGRFLYSHVPLWYVFGGGTQLTVLSQAKAPPTTLLFPPSSEEIESKNQATLVCLVNNFYPGAIQVTWKADNTEVSDGVETTRPSKQSDNLYLASSYLSLSATDWKSHDAYTCQVTHDGVNYEASVRRAECS